MFLLPSITARQRDAYREQHASPAPSLGRAIHRVFVADGLYAIILLFLLDGVLVGSRLHILHMWGYDFIWVNLILAIVPYGSSLCADLLFRFMPRRGRRIQFLGLPMFLLFVLWLLFLPNAPYVLTDFRHMEHFTRLQALYDTMMLGTYAVTGYALGVMSLIIMQRIVFAAFGGRAGRIFVFASCFLAGIGVHLGRTLRYNSWDVFSQATAVLGTVLDRLLHLYNHPYTLFDGLYYGVLLLAGYGAVIALGSKETRAVVIGHIANRFHRPGTRARTQR
jgi:uncharacterized membrane protein